MNNSGPIAATNPATATATIFTIAGAPFSVCNVAVSIFTNGTNATETISPIEIIKPSNADANPFIAPADVASIIDAIRCAAPSAFSNSVVKVGKVETFF